MADKTLLTLKKIDLAGQVAMIVLPPLYSLVMQGLEAGYAHLLGGVGRLGYWQVVSFLVHLGYRGAPWIAGGRRLYGLGLVLFIFGIVCCFMMPALIFPAIFVLPVIIPAMAILYICITIAELNALNRIDRIGQNTPSNTTSL